MTALLWCAVVCRDFLAEMAKPEQAEIVSMVHDLVRKRHGLSDALPTSSSSFTGGAGAGAGTAALADADSRGAGATATTAASGAIVTPSPAAAGVPSPQAFLDTDNPSTRYRTALCSKVFRQMLPNLFRVCERHGLYSTMTFPEFLVFLRETFSQRQCRIAIARVRGFLVCPEIANMEPEVVRRRNGCALKCYDWMKSNADTVFSYLRTRSELRYSGCGSTC